MGDLANSDYLGERRNRRGKLFKFKDVNSNTYTPMKDISHPNMSGSWWAHHYGRHSSGAVWNTLEINPNGVCVMCYTPHKCSLTSTCANAVLLTYLRNSESSLFIRTWPLQPKSALGDRYQLLSELQSAYRKHRSTETATSKVMSDVYEAADAGSVTLLGHLDISAAFDTVNHRILLDRLGTTTGLGKWPSSGMNPTWQGAVNSFVSTGSFQGLYQSTPVGPKEVRPGADPLYLLLGCSHRHRTAPRLEGAMVHAFADHLRLYGLTVQSGAADLLARMSNCVESVASWMSSNRLRLNPSKTELIWLGTSRRLQHCAGLTMSVCGADVRPVECVCDLGVLIDSNMTLMNHVNNVVGICFYQLRQLRIIRRSLTTEAAHLLVRALIHTRVEYYNGLLATGPKYLHEKLQCILRATARLVLQLQHCASVLDIMRRQLHWLEMPDRIRFKLYTLVFRNLHGLAPRYLSDLCTPATVPTHLRSSVTLERSLLVPRTKTRTMGPRGFYFASSASWNALPVHLVDPGLSLNNFKIKLKTHFFSWSPPPGDHVFCVRRARQHDNL